VEFPIWTWVQPVSTLIDRMSTFSFEQLTIKKGQKQQPIYPEGNRTQKVKRFILQLETTFV